MARALWPFVALGALALALRVVVIPDRQTLEVAPVIVDEGNYLGIAEAIAAGQGIPDRWPWLRPPGYPLLLALLLRLSDGDLRAPLLAQAVAGAVTVLAVAALAAQLWGRRAALLAAAWMALDPSPIYATRLLHTESIYTALLVIVAVCLVRWIGQATPRWLIGAALVAGLAAIVRPTLVAAIPFLLAWIVWWGWRASGTRAGLRAALLFLCCWLLPIAPVTIHNWYRYERFIPLDTTTGYNLWRDHRSIGLTALHEELMAIPNPGDRHQYALRQGLAWMWAHPGATLEKSVRNLQIQWGVSVYADDGVGKRPGIADSWRATYAFVALASWLLLVPLAIGGLWRARAPGRLGPLLALGVLGPSLGVALTHPDARFFLPSLPLLVALAAGAFGAPPTIAIARWRTSTALVCAGLFLLAVWPVSGPLLADWGRPTYFFGTGRVAEALGRDDLARRHYLRAADEATTPSEPHFRLALLAQRQGDTTAAMAAARLALDTDPQNYRAQALVVRLLRAQGDVAAAQRFARSQGRLAPAILAWAWRHADEPPPERLRLDGTDVGFVRGGFGAEQGEGAVAFRWTGARAQFRLAPPPDQPAQLTFVLASPLSPDDPPLVASVRVNGRAVGVLTVRRELGWNTLTLPLPTDLDRTTPLVVELSSATLRTLPDRRGLGLAVAEVSVLPHTGDVGQLPGTP